MLCTKWQKFYFIIRCRISVKAGKNLTQIYFTMELGDILKAIMNTQDKTGHNCRDWFQQPKRFLQVLHLLLCSRPRKTAIAFSLMKPIVLKERAERSLSAKFSQIKQLLLKMEQVFSPAVCQKKSHRMPGTLVPIVNPTIHIYSGLSASLTVSCAQQRAVLGTDPLFSRFLP